MENYLQSTDIIDWKHPDVSEKASLLAAGASDITVIVRNCFEWVRDEIKHSYDYRLNPVTCSASDVLKKALVIVMQKATCWRLC